MATAAAADTNNTDGLSSVLEQWLDSKSSDLGLTLSSRYDLKPILDQEDAYENFAKVILSPCSQDNNNNNEATPSSMTARSYRALQVFIQDLKLSSPEKQQQQLALARFQQQRGLFGQQDLTLSSSSPTLVTSSAQANLLTKQIFHALDKNNDDNSDKINILHVSRLLEALLEAYPAAVVSATCSGGKDGIGTHLGPLMKHPTSYPTLTSLILYGCTGAAKKTSAEQTQQGQQQQQQGAGGSAAAGGPVKEGTRRKFVRGLIEWNFMSKLASCIVHHYQDHSNNNEGNDNHLTSALGGIVGGPEDACEALLTIVECLAYPDNAYGVSIGDETQTQQQHHEVGEKELLSRLAQSDWWEPLVQTVVAGSNSGTATDAKNDLHDDLCKTAAARTLMGIFTLVTGRSSRIRGFGGGNVMEDITEDGDVSNIESNKEGQPTTGGDDKVPHFQEKKLENSFQKWELVEKIQLSLIHHLPTLLQALSLSPTSSATATKEEKATVPMTGEQVHHVPSFTSWRLHIVTLLAEIISNREISKDEEAEASIQKKKSNKKKNVADSSTSNKNALPCHVALDLIMEMKLPAALLEAKKKKKKKGKPPHPQQQDETTQSPESAKNDNSNDSNDSNKKMEDDNDSPSLSTSLPENPWPVLCDWVFMYPENCLYHVQFLRLFRSICLDHHETTLKLVLQTCKFVTRGIRAMDTTPSLRGLLLSCFNILRLRCQSLGPHQYLYHFLDSHDVWKGYQSKLYDLTMKQQQPLVGTIPGRENEIPLEYDGIDLGSRYASQLGLGAFTKYVVESPSSTTLPSSQQQQPTAAEATTTSGEGENDGGGESTKSKKKKKKKKKK